MSELREYAQILIDGEDILCAEAESILDKADEIINALEEANAELSQANVDLTTMYNDLANAEPETEQPEIEEPPKKEEESKGWTREMLLEVKRKRGFPGLRDVGNTFQVKSTSSDGIINKILNAQDARQIEPKAAKVDFVCVGIEQLYHQPINYEEGRLGSVPRFQPLVTEPEGEMIVEALKKFGIRWGFTFEFVLKFQAFRCIKNGKHVDWIQLNELCKMYTLPINPTVMVLSKRLYTKPNVRAWRIE